MKIPINLLTPVIDFEFSEDDGPNPSGGLVSTAHELFRFYQMILNDGKLGRNRLLSSDAVKKNDLTAGG